MSLDVHIYYHSSESPPSGGNNLFHSTELFTICDRTRGYTPILVVAYQNHQPVGRLLGIIRKSVRTFPPSFIKRCEVYGFGEYATGTNQEAIFGQMLQALTRVAVRRCFLIEFRNLQNPMFAYWFFRKNKYFPINWLRIHNSLHSKAPEERLSNSRRRQIHHALHNGATMHVAQTAEDVQSFLRILNKYYASKIRRHFPRPDFFYQLLQSNKDKELGHIFVVKYKEKVIGGSVCVYSENNAYLWFSAGLRKSYPRQYPGVLAVWAAIQYAYDHGYDHMEFMDVGLPFKQYGYRDFILRFGGVQYGTRRWFRFRWNWLNRFLTRFYI